MSRRILAINIRTQHLSAVLLSTGIKSMVIEACEGIELAPTLSPQGRENGLQQALDQLAQKIETSDAAVIVGLPAQRCFFRTLTLPFGEEKKIRQILAFELEPTLPLPVDQLLIDFQDRPVGDGAAILAAAIDREYLNTILETFSSIGLHPQLIVPGGFPLVAALTFHGPQPSHDMLMLDMDQNQATLFAISQGYIRLVRSMQHDMTDAGGVDNLALKIRHTLAGGDDTLGSSYIPAALLCTGSADFSQVMAKALGAALDMSVQTIDLRRMIPKIDMAPSAAQWQAEISDGALALALIAAENSPCLRFHHTGSAFHSLWAAYKPYIKAPVALACLTLVLFFSGLWWDIRDLNQQVTRINEKIAVAITAAFPDVVRISDRPSDQMLSKLTEFKKNLVDPTLGGQQARIIDIVNQISQLIPKEDNVILKRLFIGGNSITIAGETIDFNTVEEVKSRLEKSELFRKVDITSSDRDKNGNKVRFRLNIDL